MANVIAIVSVEMLDSLGIQVSHDLFVECADTKTLADVNTFLAAYLPKLDAITDAQITGVKYKMVGTLPGGLKASPAAHSEVEKTGLFNFSQADSAYKFGIDVPAISDGVIVNGKVDLTNSDVSTFYGFITTVTQGFTIVSKFVKALGALLDVLISFRKHRKAETRRSFVVNE